MNSKYLSVLFLSLLMISSYAFSKPDHANRPGGLPPGLEKKSKNGKPPPPGWQKKLQKGEVLENDIFTRGRIIAPVGKDGSITIEVEGAILRLHEKTRRIIEILK